MSEVNQIDLLDDKPQEVKADLRKFNKAEDQVNKAIAACSTIKLEAIKTPADADKVTDILKKTKQVETLIEDKRKELVKPFNDAVKRINDYAKNLTAKIGPAISEGKKVLLSYHEQQEKERKQKRTDARTAQLLGSGFLAQDGSFVKDGVVVPMIIVSSLEDGPYASEMARINRQLEENRLAAVKALEERKEAASFFGEDEETELIDEQIDLVKSAPVPTAPVHVPSFGGVKTKGVTKTWTFDLEDLSEVPREYLVLDETKVRAAIKEGARHIPGIRIYQKESISLR